MSVIVLKLHIFVFFSETFGSIGKLKIYLHKLHKQVEKQAFVELFCPISQWVQINYIFSNNVHILCLSYHIRKTKTTAKLTRKNRNKFFSFLIVSSVKASLILLPFRTVALHESGTRKTISWSVTVYNKYLSSQCNLTAQIEPLQNKFFFVIANMLLLC